MQFERMANRESNNLEEVKDAILQTVEGDKEQIETALELFADYTFGRFIGENHSIALAEMLGYKTSWADSRTREIRAAELTKTSPMQKYI